jgi:spore coat protein CotF
MNKKVENPKTEVEEGINYNYCDFVNIAMTIEKNMSNNYSIAIDEASNTDLYNEYFDMFEKIKDNARSLYDFSFKNGWYSLTKEDSKEINTKLQELESKMDALNLDI